jgi:hypothetical protein
MPFIADRVLDLGLNVLDVEANALHICSSEPTTYSQAITGGSVSLGSKTLAAAGIGAPAARSPSGRRVTVAAITDGNVTNTGTAAAWAIVDTTNSRLLATGLLAATQAVTASNVFTLTAFDIGIPGAA